MVHARDIPVRKRVREVGVVDTKFRRNNENTSNDLPTWAYAKSKPTDNE